ncbi:TIGR00730 family Rossman fold protein [Bifidobacterium bombi]|uniref:Cytokinin riboside 5'-monophosphate phosphoribohydrolase n=1 Tax=Bifidobacterium bombi DSM 19703 TaxID=1341695 RepID=A0A086BPC6_9BIFI|nr:TIGR00730 family Rossman fold protein [Bifidobacterium bombi]KFF31790.1 putative lysine decarboxylase [Bifidobacterium bombi DSM 19703]
MKVTVYCGAASGRVGEYKEEIERLGVEIAQAGDELVYGGGRTGLMGAVARAVHDHGGKVLGVIPQVLKDREIADSSITDSLEIVADMDVRKRRLMAAGDVTITFPGGAGTLEEFSQAFSWARLGLNDKPCVLYDFNGFWDPMKEMIDRMVADGFVSPEHSDKLLFSHDYTEIRRFAASYQPPAPRMDPESDSR